MNTDSTELHEAVTFLGGLLADICAAEDTVNDPRADGPTARNLLAWNIAKARDILHGAQSDQEVLDRIRHEIERQTDLRGEDPRDIV